MLFFFTPGLSPSRCGTLPFSFISWFSYSCYLVAKISLILSSDIPAFISDDTKGNLLAGTCSGFF